MALDCKPGYYCPTTRQQLRCKPGSACPSKTDAILENFAAFDPTLEQLCPGGDVMALARLHAMLMSGTQKK